MTLSPLETVSLLRGEKRQKSFVVARVKVEGDLLTARGVDPEFKKLKEVGTASELEREIGENLEDGRLYVKSVRATKWAEDQAPRLEKILEAFGKWK